MTDALPEWLLGLQAVVWLATGDVGLTLQARPGPIAAADHRAVLPATGSIMTWQGNRSPAPSGTATPVRSQLDMSEEPGPTLDGHDRVQLAGAPSEWGGGFSLTYLSIITGRRSEPYVQTLVETSRSGKVATVDREGNSIGSPVWNRHSMREALRRPGVLIMVPEPYQQTDEDTAVEPLFRRDDVIRLGMANKTSPAKQPSVNTSRKPTDEEVAEFIEGKRAEWSGAGKKHGRDQLLAEAARHFGVARKYLLAVWKRKRLRKNRSTPKRS